MTTYLFERHLGHEMFCFNTLSFKTLPTPLLLHSYLFSCHEHCSDKFFCLEFWVLFGYVCIWIICRKSQSFASKTVSQENVLWSVKDVGGCSLANTSHPINFSHRQIGRYHFHKQFFLITREVVTDISDHLPVFSIHSNNDSSNSHTHDPWRNLWVVRGLEPRDTQSKSWVRDECSQIPTKVQKGGQGGRSGK